MFSVYSKMNGILISRIYVELLNFFLILKNPQKIYIFFILFYFFLLVDIFWRIESCSCRWWASPSIVWQVPFLPQVLLKLRKCQLYWETKFDFGNTYENIVLLISVQWTWRMISQLKAWFRHVSLSLFSFKFFFVYTTVLLLNCKIDA